MSTARINNIERESGGGAVNIAPGKVEMASQTTMDLSGVPNGTLVKITGATTIESFGAGVDGKQVVIVLDDEVTIQNNANTNTSTGEDYEARPAVINERIRMLYDDGQWHFISLPPPVRIQNANGSAVRWPADWQESRTLAGLFALTTAGRMGSSGMYRSTNVDADHPAQFSETPVVSGGVQRVVSGTGVGLDGARTSHTSTRVRSYYVGTEQDDEFEGEYLCAGRWK